MSVPTLANDNPDIIEVARFGRGIVHTIAWRPDGEVLAVGSSTGVWFFDEEFNELGRLAEDMIIDTLEWSPDGQRLIAFNSSYQTDNCQIIIWNVSQDVQTASQDKVLDHCAESVDWSPDGELIAFGVSDGGFGDNAKVLVYSHMNYKIPHEFPDIGLYAKFSPDNQYIAIGHFISENPIKILELDSENIISKISAKEASGRPLWSADGKYISTSCFDETLFKYYGYGNCIWDVETSKLVFTTLASIIWHPLNNQFLAVETSFWGSPDRATFIGIHQGFSGDAVSNSVFADIINDVVWHPSGEFFTTLAVGQGISQFDGQTSELIKTHGLFQPRWKEVTWIPEATELLTIGSIYDDQNSTVQVWSLDSQDTYKPKQNQLIGDIDEIQWIDDTQNFIVHSAGGMGYYWTNIWDANTLEHVDRIYEHFDQYNTIPTYRFSLDMSHVAIYAPDYHDHIEVIDNLYTRDNPVEIASQADRIKQIEWSPDGSMIATAGTIGDIDISHFLVEFWDADTGEILSSIGLSWLQHYDRFIWHPDNNSIAVLSNRPTGSGCDLSVDIYRIPFGEIYQSVPSIRAEFQAYERGHNIDAFYPYCRIPTVSWSPSGKLIAISFGNGIRIYNPNQSNQIAEILIGRITSLDWHDSGQYLAGGASDGTIYVWDVSALLD